MASSKPFLLLALTPLGWGETAFAVHLGKGLRKQNREAVVLTRRATLPLFAGSGLTCELVDEGMECFLQLLVDEVIDRYNPEALVLCDIATTGRAFRLGGISPELLLEYKIPLIGVDTWDGERTGERIDLFQNGGAPVDCLLDERIYRLKPVPFLPPGRDDGKCQFIPDIPRVAHRVRAHVRRELGVGNQDRVILFVSAQWQHGGIYGNADGERLAARLPLLIATYIDQLGERVRLVHVGPAPFDLKEILGDRYNWMPSQQPAVFETLLASSDMLLSANPTAVTINKALALNIPILVLQNSIRALNVEDIARELGSPLHPLLRQWAADSLPIYPFSLWPLGYREYLVPVLTGNPLLQTSSQVEICDGEGVIAAFNQLLFSPEAREALICAQQRYVEEVLALPTAVELTFRYLDVPMNDDRYGRQEILCKY